jgi:aryl-alcohol dehydrogenase-like predicted oxidoreductase
MSHNEKLERRRFGKSDLLVTPIGLGLAALGRPGYITLGHDEDMTGDHSIEAMATRTHTMLDSAWQAGVRYFDAARSYGRAEEFLGSWLADRIFDPADAPVVGSKWGYVYTAGWRVDAAQHEMKDHTLPLLRQQWQETQRCLGSALNLYQIHSATLESGVLSRSDVLSELAALKASGTLIGLSLSGAQQSAVLEKALRVEVDGVRLFNSVQATWNLLEPSSAPLLQSAYAEGLGVIVKEALANGRLTARNQAADFSPQLTLLTALAVHHQTTVDAVALAAALQQPWATVVLSGAATPAQLNSNLTALDVRLSQEDREQLGKLVESPERYWATRSALPWN